MKRIQIIQKTTAFFLLLLFAVSMGPRAYFHDLVADHHDGSGCVIKHEQTVLHQEEIECHFDDLVVSESYIFQLLHSLSSPSVHHLPGKTEINDCYIRVYAKNNEGRGPPVVISNPA